MKLIQILNEIKESDTISEEDFETKINSIKNQLDDSIDFFKRGEYDKIKQQITKFLKFFNVLEDEIFDKIDFIEERLIFDEDKFKEELEKCASKVGRYVTIDVETNDEGKNILNWEYKNYLPTKIIFTINVNSLKEMYENEDLKGNNFILEYKNSYYTSATIPKYIVITYNIKFHKK